MPHSNKSNHKPNSKNDKPSTHQLRFEAIGTRWVIDLFSPVSAKKLQTVEATILRRINAFDQAYSRFRSDSLVTAMSKQAGKYELPPDAEPLLQLYRQLYEATDGAVTPLIGQSLSQAGYDANYSFIPGKVDRTPAWDTVMKYKKPFLDVKQSVLLDFGAAGKGYLTDLVGEQLQEQGISNYCVNAGGDMVYHTSGTDRLLVALEHPDDDQQAIGVANLYNQSIAGSSGNRRAWQGYHHIMNPHTASSPTHLKAVWVVAENGLLSDGLATALFFASPQNLMQKFSFAYALVRNDNTLEYSKDFPADFFTTETAA
jgi:thiamine biosynthesis lipoprotein